MRKQSSSRFMRFSRSTRTSKALKLAEPRLGLRFSSARHYPRLARMVPIPGKSKPDPTIKGYLVAKLGPRGFGRLKQQLDAVTASVPTPSLTSKKKSRRRPKIAA